MIELIESFQHSRLDDGFQISPYIFDGIEDGWSGWFGHPFWNMNLSVIMLEQQIMPVSIHERNQIVEEEFSVADWIQNSFTTHQNSLSEIRDESPIHDSATLCWHTDLQLGITSAFVMQDSNLNKYNQ